MTDINFYEIDKKNSKNNDENDKVSTPSYGTVEEIDSEQLESLIKNKESFFLDVYAPWCGPCKTIFPKIQELAKENKSMKFVKVDLEDLKPEQSKMLSIVGVPTFVLFDKGDIKEKIVGANLNAIKKLF